MAFFLNPAFSFDWFGVLLGSDVCVALLRVTFTSSCVPTVSLQAILPKELECQNQLQLSRKLKADSKTQIPPFKLAKSRSLAWHYIPSYLMTP